VKLEPAGDNTKPGLFFTVPDIQRTAADLKSRGLEVKTTPTAVSVTDPDGVIITFTRGAAR
jgi:catechol 2,3-dioxygenase-like lactoylglutathione lyase family enzyme